MPNHFGIFFLFLQRSALQLCPAQELSITNLPRIKARIIIEDCKYFQIANLAFQCGWVIMRKRETPSQLDSEKTGNEGSRTHHT